MKKTEAKSILVSVPLPILKKIEAAARAEMRSRNAEICIRLGLSLKAAKAPKAGVSA